MSWHRRRFYPPLTCSCGTLTISWKTVADQAQIRIKEMDQNVAELEERLTTERGRHAQCSTQLKVILAPLPFSDHQAYLTIGSEITRAS